MGFGGEGGALSTEEREFIAERGLKEGEAKAVATENGTAIHRKL